MGLHLAARLTDEATARRVQLAIDYDPQPPFGRIDWAHVGRAAPDGARRDQPGGAGDSGQTEAAHQVRPEGTSEGA